MKFGVAFNALFFEALCCLIPRSENGISIENRSAFGQKTSFIKESNFSGKLWGLGK